MRIISKKLTTILLILFTLMMGSGNYIYAESGNPENDPNTNHLPTLEDSGAIERLANNFFYGKISSGSIPGAAIAVVENGKVVFKKGYGFADLEHQTTVDPDQTVFGLGSVGKLFTGTAVMQLAEKGAVKLDEDVNNYLNGIKINNPYSKPVTFAGLLTHTSGLDEESLIGGAAHNPGEVMTYEEFIKAKHPTVISEPGSSIRYANMNYDLLGYLIRVISGEPYQNYIRENILSPLEMKNTIIAQPSAKQAKGYISEGGKFNPTENYIYSPPLGSGCINATASDVANFMIAHLQNGKFGNARILKEETAELMHRQQFTNNAELPGMAYSFIQSYRNNQDILKHEGGDPGGYSSSLFLLPKYKFGFFVVTNCLSDIPFQFEDEFLNEFFPASKPNLLVTSPDLQNNLRTFAGVYSSHDGISQSTIAKMVSLFSGDGIFTVTNNNDGTLSLKGSGMTGEQPVSTKLAEIKPLVFQREDDNGYVAFQKNQAGQISQMFTDTAELTFDKLKWYETPVFNQGLLVTCILLFMITCLISLFSCRRKSINQPGPGKPPGEKAARLLALIVCLLQVVCITGVFATATNIGYDIVFGVPALFCLFLAGLMLGSVLSAGLIPFTILAWKKKYWTMAGRIHYTLIAFATLAFVWFLMQWNILGFRL